MGPHGESHGPAPDRRTVVVVPHRPGPLLSFDRSRSGRGRDDLDDLVDDLVADVEEGAGAFDAALLLVGAGLLTWTLIGTAPVIVTVLGVAALLLGCVLPARTAWRRARDRQRHRHRKGLLENGLLMDVSSASAARLVGAYEDLFGIASRSASELADPALSAAHCAVSEVASLLEGRAAASEREVRYIDMRAEAVAALVGALRALPASSEPSGGDLFPLRTDALIAARDELDRITPFGSVARLEELLTEARMRRHDGR